eukprot:1130769_1
MAIANACVFILTLSLAFITSCNSKTFFNGYAHIHYDSEPALSSPKYNHFLNGTTYQMHIFTAFFYFSLFVCIGMCIGGCIMYFETKCNEPTEHQHIRIKNGKPSLIKVQYAT